MIFAGILAVTPTRRHIHVIVMMAVIAASTAGGILLILDFLDGGAIAHGVGGWVAGIAIPFAADMFTALMLAVTGILTLTCAWFAVASGRAQSRFFAPMLLVLLAGVNGALLTADLFNLFVFIEVMLLPSYGLFLLAAPDRAPIRRIAGVRLYVTLNLLTSTVFLVGVGFLYGTAGTVNIAELSGLAASDETVAIATAVCLFALGIKAAVVPVHGWLARAYPTTSPAITALFSGLHTKIAIFAIYRIYAVVFDGDPRFLWIGIAVFTVTMIVGALGAAGENSSRSMLAFNMVSGIGYILLGVALFTPLGLVAGIFYLIHHMIVKASLFLSTGAVEVRYGTDKLGAFRGVAKTEPLIAAAFFVAALSLAGLPPFSGFVAKLSLILAAQDAGEIVAVVVMILVSLVTLLAMLRIWSGMFWGSRSSEAASSLDAESADEESADAASVAGSGTGTAGATDTLTRTRPRIGASLAAPAIVLAVITLGLGLGAELLLGLAQIAADGLLDTSAYVEAVLGS
ncbi:monovalent cation/H+ antiporter subunit D family protein [Microbacterium aurantiacum]